MFGAAFVELLDAVEQRCGLAEVDALLSEVGLGDAAFTTFQVYDYDAFARLAAASTARLELSADGVMEMIGGRLVERIFTADPKFAVGLSSPASALLRLPGLHLAWFRAVFPEGDAPQIAVSPVKDGRLRVFYRSPRPLVRFVSGAARQIGKRYSQSTTIGWSESPVDPCNAVFYVSYSDSHQREAA